MIFEQALAIIDQLIAGISMTRPQHVEAQQAIQALTQRYQEALGAVETSQAQVKELQAQLDATNEKPLHRD